MLNDEICKLREKLNNSILHENDYNVTYQISVQLDELIAQYYKTEVNLANGNCNLKKKLIKSCQYKNTNSLF